MRCIEDSARAIASADGWHDLEKAFPDEISRRGKYEFVLYIGAIYGAANPKPVSIINEPIPGVQVNSGGRTYYIHGIVHDGTHDKLVNESFAGIENIVIETLLLDKGMLEKASRQPRLDEVKYCSMVDYYRDIYSRVSFKKKPEFKKNDATWEDALMHHQCCTGEECIDIRLANYPEHLEHKIAEYKMEDWRNRLAVMRSLAQAEFIRKTAEKNGWAESHALCGLYHEQDIAYFLNNAGRTAELAERLKWRARRNFAINVSAPCAGVASIGAIFFSFSLTPWALLASPFILPLTAQTFLSSGLLFLEK